MVRESELPHAQGPTLCAPPVTFILSPGILEIELLSVLWEGYTEHTPDLIALMVKFGLFVPLYDDQAERGNSTTRRQGRGSGAAGGTNRHMMTRSMPLTEVHLFLVPALLPPYPPNADAWSNEENLHTFYLVMLNFLIIFR